MIPALHHTARRPAGFTLIEVILAIVIALAILVVVLHFYQQATELRSQVIEETERIAAARLLMDRITGELRGALPEWSLAPPFLGSSNTIQFIRADVPSFASWTGATLNRSASPVTDLKRVRYRLESAEGTNTAGVIRSEEGLVIRRQLGVSDELGQTNATAVAAGAPVMEEIRYLQFRYWSGTTWLDSWSGGGCPAGVEVTLGAEPVTNGMDLAEYPGEIYRRVIYLVAGSQAASAAGSLRTGPAATDQEVRP